MIRRTAECVRFPTNSGNYLRPDEQSRPCVEAAFAAQLLSEGTSEGNNGIIVLKDGCLSYLQSPANFCWGCSVSDLVEMCVGI